MARAKKEPALTPEERLQAALVPDWEWPYKLPENWCWTRIGNYVDYVTDYVANGSFASLKANVSIFKDENYALMVKTQDFANGFTKSLTYTDKHGYDFLSKSTLHGGELILSNIGSVGKVFRVPYFDRPMTLASNSVMVKCYNSRDYDWMYYFLLSPIGFEELKSITTGTAVPKFNKTDLKTIPLPVPPLAEQQRIVDRIESLFAKLDEAKEKAQAVVDSIETRKAAILHKAFTGELTAKWREEHGVGMDSWEHHQFSDLCAIVRGGSPRPAGDPRYYDGNIPFMKVADITRNDSPYVSKVEYSIKEEGLKKTRMVEANTLLLTNSGATLGVPAITTIRTTFNDGIAAFIGLDIDSLLFYYYFWTSKTAFLRSINMGAAQPNLNTKLIGEVEIDVPQTAERVEIARVLNALLSKEQQAKEAAEAVLDQIDLMKKSILARAFRGELGTNDPSEESAVELLKRVL